MVTKPHEQRYPAPNMPTRQIAHEHIAAGVLYFIGISMARIKRLKEEAFFPYLTGERFSSFTLRAFSNELSWYSLMTNSLSEKVIHYED